MRPPAPGPGLGVSEAEPALADSCCRMQDQGGQPISLPKGTKLAVTGPLLEAAWRPEPSPPLPLGAPLGSDTCGALPHLVATISSSPPSGDGAMVAASGRALCGLGRIGAPWPSTASSTWVTVKEHPRPLQFQNVG